MLPEPEVVVPEPDVPLPEPEVVVPEPEVPEPEAPEPLVMGMPVLVGVPEPLPVVALPPLPEPEPEPVVALPPLLEPEPPLTLGRTVEIVSPWVMPDGVVVDVEPLVGVVAVAIWAEVAVVDVGI
jgi:fused signal recognition particle receptor